MTRFDVAYLSAVGMRRLLHVTGTSFTRQRAHYRVAAGLMRHVTQAVAAGADECYCAVSTGTSLVCGPGLLQEEVVRRVEEVNGELRALEVPISIEWHLLSGLTRLSTETWEELTKLSMPKRNPSDYLALDSSPFARLADGGAAADTHHLSRWIEEVAALRPALSHEGSDTATRRWYLRGDVRGHGRALTRDEPDLATFRARSEAVTEFFDVAVPRLARATLPRTGLLLHCVSDDIVAVGSRSALEEFARATTAAFAKLNLGDLTVAMTRIEPSEPLAESAGRAATLLVAARGDVR